MDKRDFWLVDGTLLMRSVLNDKHLLVPEFVLSRELPWTLWTLERTLSRMQHLVTSHMLWPGEFFPANVTGMVVMLFRCSAKIIE